MLTSEQSIVEYRAGEAFPDRLLRSIHRHYIPYAEKMLHVYRQGQGQERRQLHRAVADLLADEPDCPVRRVEAFCKLLDDKSTYQTDPRGKCGKLRLAVFSAAARLHPIVQSPDQLFSHDVAEARAIVVDAVGKPWDQIEQELYADVTAFQQLKAFEGYADAAALLSRYNEAQLQASLYRAENMVIDATGDFKTILRYAKLARLLHEIQFLGQSHYRIRLTGPASILHETRRYGVNMARFLSALLTCGGWKASAVLQTPWGTKATLSLSDAAGFTSHLPPAAEFDSCLEEAFAAKFGAEPRDGWSIIREGEILHDGQTVFIPDFVFRHEDGTQVLLEIVGFWTPEYLAKKRETVRRFQKHRILLAVPERSLREGATVTENVLVYKTVLKLKPLLDRLEQIRTAGRAEPSRDR